MSNVQTEVWHNMERDTVEVRVSIPFHEYAGSLWPNETVRDAVIESLDRFLDERRG